MSNQIQSDSEYFSAFQACFKNRSDLVDTINKIDYILSESESNQGRCFTVNDLFLEKSEKLGMRCAGLLLQQVRYQYHLLHHIPHNGDFEILLDEFHVDAGCLKHILSTEVRNHDLSMTETQTFVHITCAETRIPFKPIECQSLVKFTDKFLQLILTKLQDHQNDCKLEKCNHCTSLSEEDIEAHSSPLLKDFGVYEFDETDSTDCQEYRDFENPINRMESNVSFNEQAGPTLQEEFTWEHFRTLVLRKYNDLKKYYEDNFKSFKDEELSVVILYTDTKDVVKVVYCASIAEARIRANSLQDISNDPFSVVLISVTDYEFPKIVSRKRMVQKLRPDSPSKVGEEESPSLLGTLQTPAGRKPFQFPLLFYIDTGADTGSVGYNYHIIKHFILTVENINGSYEPAILCNFVSDNITEEDIQVFDVDGNPDWNAIGLSVLKNYRIYLDIKNGKVKIGKHEDVIEEENEKTFQVIFKQEIAKSIPFPDDL